MYIPENKNTIGCVSNMRNRMTPFMKKNILNIIFMELEHRICMKVGIGYACYGCGYGWQGGYGYGDALQKGSGYGNSQGSQSFSTPNEYYIIR